MLLIKRILRLIVLKSCKKAFVSKVSQFKKKTLIEKY